MGEYVPINAMVTSSFWLLCKGNTLKLWDIQNTVIYDNEMKWVVFKRLVPENVELFCFEKDQTNWLFIFTFLSLCPSLKF